jgi:uncharacterized protein YsxB (DUF464 family)
MIRARYGRRSLSLDLRGHALFAPKGQDIVCAAASALACTAAAALEDEAERFYPRVVKRPGSLRIACEPAEGSRRACRRLMDTIWIGFELLARDFPECVSVEKEE